MTRSWWSTACVLGVVAGCGDDGAASIDAQPIDPIDAAIDAPSGPCGADLVLTGEYIDWDSTNARFDGVENAEWKVVSPADGPTATTAPNGRIMLCIKRTATSQIDVTQPNYLPARFVADGPAFNTPGATFSVRGLQVGAGPAQLGELGEGFDPGSAQVLVYKIGAPIPLALEPVLSPPQRSYVSDGSDDATWSPGNMGTLTFFPNRPAASDATLTSTASFVGPATLPLAAGRFTITVIR